LRAAAAAGARSATIITSGFDEIQDHDGVRLTAELKSTIYETDLAVCGPNCLGNINAAAKFFSMPDDRAQTFVEGPVAVVSQSGAISLAIKRSLEERGIDTCVVVTSGNEAGITAGDYISYLTTMPSIRLIVCYLEAVRGSKSFIAACQIAREAGIPVVVLKLGATPAGRASAAAHSGALAGSAEAFEALALDIGVLCVKTTDELVETAEFLLHSPLPKGRRAGGIASSGGMKGLMSDGGAIHGVLFDRLDESRDVLTELWPPGIKPANPLDTGFAASGSIEPIVNCVKTFLDQPNCDMVLLTEELPRAPGSKRREDIFRHVDRLAASSKKPIVFISIVSYGLSDYSRRFRSEIPHVAIMQEPDRSLRVLRAVADYGAREIAQSSGYNRVTKAATQTLTSLRRSVILDEFASKRVLSEYGIDSPKEEVATDLCHAIEIAGHIGYPVVAKLTAEGLMHKSDVGGVILNINSTLEMQTSYQRLMQISEKTAASGVARVLVAQMIHGGMELLLGVKRDPEVGPVILFGTGGGDVEVVKDVALAALPLDERRADRLINRTRAGFLLNGYRGRPPLAREVLIKALVGLSDLTMDAEDRIESIDINPFVLRERDGFALDAVVVTR
jgi:acetyltransferase